MKESQQNSELVLQRDQALVRKIQSGSVRAWHRFIDLYGDLILFVIRKHVHGDDDLVRSIFADTLEHLHKKSLSGYDGRAALSTWLVLMTRGQVWDYLRHKYGRQRPPTVLSNLSPLERRIFRLYFRQDLGFDEVRQCLTSEGRSVSVETLADALGRIEAKLSRRVLRQMSYERKARSLGIGSGRILEFLDNDLAERQWASWEISPDRLLSAKESGHDPGRIGALIEKLPEDERNVLTMRFAQNLTARQICEKLNLKNPRKVYTITDRALRRLRGLLREAQD